MGGSEVAMTPAVLVLSFELSDEDDQRVIAQILEAAKTGVQQALPERTIRLYAAFDEPADQVTDITKNW